MCSIVILVQDMTNPNDFYTDCQLLKSGDVIEIVPDGWVFTPTEQAFPTWRILNLPGLDPSLVSQFLSPMIPANPLQTKTLLRRANKFDWTKIGNSTWGQNHPTLAAAFLNYMNDGTRAQSSLNVPQATVAQLQNILSTVQTVVVQPADPAIIGTPANNVIG